MIPGMGGGMSASNTDTTTQTQKTSIDAALRASGVRGLIANTIASGQARLETATSAADSGMPPMLVWVIAAAAGVALWIIWRRNK